MNVEDEPIAMLEGYAAQRADQFVVVDGGPELRVLPLNAPCYHKSEPLRLLRLESKSDLTDGGVRLKLALGRPLKEPLAV
jgi:hypothetical protein